MNLSMRARRSDDEAFANSVRKKASASCAMLSVMTSLRIMGTRDLAEIGYRTVLILAGC
jgi:hypothetical protein